MQATTTPSAMAAGPGGIPDYLWNMPALPPPKGRLSNFDHPESRGTELLITSSICLCLTLPAVAMRFVACHESKDKVGWDAYMCINATLALVAHSGLIAYGVSIGFGTRLWDLRAMTFTDAKILRLHQLSTIYIVAICFAKLSVLLLYLRLFWVVDLTRHLIRIGLFVTVISSLAFLGLEITQTVRYTSLDALTDKSNKLVVIQAALNVALDLYILLIPLQQVYKLTVDTRTKLGLAALFGVGAIACIVSVIRLGWVARNLHDSDPIWAAYMTSEMTIIEINTVIIAPCLVSVPAFIKCSRRALSKLRTRLVRSGGNSPSIESLSQPLRHKDSYVNISEQNYKQLEFATAAEGSISPQRLLAVHAVE